MNIKRILLSAMLMVTFTTSQADEGMWLPMLINKNYEEMKRMGLKLTADDLYNVNNSSMKDAIVWFNGGCTSELISADGLLITNHHCGYDAIANNSTPANNILDNGFWAKEMKDEIKNEGMFASILVRMEDVTDQVLKGLEGVEEKDRAAKLAVVYKEITKKAIDGQKGYDALIREMYRGNAYYLYVMEKFTDIRLVGTPPQSVGKYGGDTDNWMWPRHTGDFSMFRIYAGADNKPADFSTDNVPYKPKKFLPISLKGYQKGDFTMVYGFPGRTNRYETSYGVNIATEKVNPTIVALRDFKLKAWKEEMDKSEATRLLLSSDYASIANYWKYYIGQTQQLKYLKVEDFKKSEEAKFTAWAAGKPEFENALPNLSRAYEAYRPYALQRTYLGEGLLGVTANGLALSYLNMLEKPLASKNTEEVKSAKEKLGAASEEFFKSFNIISDEKIMANFLSMYYKNIPADQHPALLAEILKKYKGATNDEKFMAFAKVAYAKSIFTDKTREAAFRANPSVKAMQADPIYQVTSAFYNNYIMKYKKFVDEFNTVNAKESRTIIKGMMVMNPDKQFYPDANSSLRISYGNVQDYAPKDAVQYAYQTTLKGVIEKEVPGDYEFDVPDRLNDLYNSRNFGQYTDPASGDVPVAFLTTNDITGGNSGSPVINANGELLGLAFDGNWEAMSGDIVFDKKYKRTICVDIRYVLFMIDKYGDAGRIIKEMDIRK